MSSIQARSGSVVSTLGASDIQLAQVADPVSDEAATHGLRQDMLPGDGHNRADIRAAAMMMHQISAIQAGPFSDAGSAKPRNIAPIPRITIHAFCENHEALAILETASRDRLMSRATLETHGGGIKAAVEFYQTNAAPNLLIVESRASNDMILQELEGLADVCDPGTRVLVIGSSNDISFYRELLRRGISEYAVLPIGVDPLIRTISSIYSEASSDKLGQVYAFVGAKGGVGSSTVAHNVGWTMARRFNSDVVLADLDLPFGTAGLDFNLDVNQGIAEAIQDASRLDEVLLDRLLLKCDDHFSLLAAPAKLDRPYDLDANAFEALLEISQANVPFTVLDIPHLWTSWARNALVAADEIVITAAPDLANLRNAKNLVSFLKQARPHDAVPKLVLNQVGMAKRPEIKPNEFARALELELLANIPFDAQTFGTAANNGKMIADVSAKSPAAQAFAQVAMGVTGRKEQKSSAKSLIDLGTLFSRKSRRS